LVFKIKFDAVIVSSERTHLSGTLRGCLVSDFAVDLLP